jgi:hypothetical protein
MELHQAFLIDRKYVLAICPEPRISPWLRYHTHRIVSSIDDAVDWLRQLSEADRHVHP